MLEEILNLAKTQLGGKLGEASLSKEQLDKSVNIVGESVSDGLKTEAQKGNLDGILNLFSGKDSVDNGNPIIKNIINNAVQKITEKLGISSSIAATIANTIVQFILSKISSKIGGGSENILSGLTGLIGTHDLSIDNIGDTLKKDLGDKLKGLF